MGRIERVEDLGPELRRLRKARGLHQVPAARRAAVRQSAVSQWETGKTTPTIENLLAYVTALGGTVEIRLTEASELTEVAATLAPAELEDVAAYVRRVGGERGTVREVLLQLVRGAGQRASSE